MLICAVCRRNCRASTSSHPGDAAMSHPDGGPAFPRMAFRGFGDIPSHLGTPGMTLRDWFAGMALQGIVADSASSGEWSEDRIATYAYQLANAMLKQQEAQS